MIEFHKAQLLRSGSTFKPLQGYGGNGDIPGSIFVSTKVWFWATICIIVMISMGNTFASAQLLPLPAPNSNNEDNKFQTKELSKGYQPPDVEILTNVLREGKNVLKVNITSEAPIKDCKITFSKGEGEKTEDCVKDSGTVFKALVDAKQPYQTVRIDAWDIYSDSSSTVEKLSVLPPLTFNEAIWNSINRIMDTTGHISESTK